MSKADFLIRMCEKANGRECACMMFQVPDSVKNRIKKLQAEVDKEDVHPEEGLEDDIHVTLLYGIEDSPEVKEQARELLASVKPVQAHTGSIEIFKPEKEDYDVIVLRAHGSAVHALRKKVESALPNKQTFPEYKPHITVGYVKKGTGDKYKDLEAPAVSFVMRSVKYSDIKKEESVMDLGGGNG